MRGPNPRETSAKILSSLSFREGGSRKKPTKMPHSSAGLIAVLWMHAGWKQGRNRKHLGGSRSKILQEICVGVGGLKPSGVNGKIQTHSRVLWIKALIQKFVLRGKAPLVHSYKEQNNELLVLIKPANIFIINSPEQGFYPKFQYFSISGDSVQALKVRPHQCGQEWSKEQTCCASLLHSTIRKKRIKIKLQICFKWPCRIDEITIFTALSPLTLQSSSFYEDVDETSQEQLFLQHTKWLPMEGYREL